MNVDKPRIHHQWHCEAAKQSVGLDWLELFNSCSAFRARKSLLQCGAAFFPLDFARITHGSLLTRGANVGETLGKGIVTHDALGHYLFKGSCVKKSVPGGT